MDERAEAFFIIAFKSQDGLLVQKVSEFPQKWQQDEDGLGYSLHHSKLEASLSMSEDEDFQHGCERLNFRKFFLGKYYKSLLKFNFLGER